MIQKSECKKCGWTSTLKNIDFCPKCKSLYNIAPEPQEKCKFCGNNKHTGFDCDEMDEAKLTKEGQEGEHILRKRLKNL